MKTQDANFARQAKWDRRFLELARFYAHWSKDPTTKVGCVLVHDINDDFSHGYNGFPQGLDDSIDRLGDRAFKNSLVLHAEENAILRADRPLKNCTVYVWPITPCSQCASRLIQKKVGRVVCVEPSTGPIRDRWLELPTYKLAMEMFVEANIPLILKPQDYLS